MSVSEIIIKIAAIFDKRGIQTAKQGATEIERKYTESINNIKRKSKKMIEDQDVHVTVHKTEIVKRQSVGGGGGQGGGGTVIIPTGGGKGGGGGGGGKAPSGGGKAPSGGGKASSGGGKGGGGGLIGNLKGLAAVLGINLALNIGDRYVQEERDEQTKKVAKAEKAAEKSYQDRIDDYAKEEAQATRKHNEAIAKLDFRKALGKEVSARDYLKVDDEYYKKKISLEARKGSALSQQMADLEWLETDMRSRYQENKQFDDKEMLGWFRTQSDFLLGTNLSTTSTYEDISEALSDKIEKLKREIQQSLTREDNLRSEQKVNKYGRDADYAEELAEKKEREAEERARKILEANEGEVKKDELAYLFAQKANGTVMGSLSAIGGTIGGKGFSYTYFDKVEKYLRDADDKLQKIADNTAIEQTHVELGFANYSNQ